MPMPIKPMIAHQMLDRSDDIQKTVDANLTMQYSHNLMFSIGMWLSPRQLRQLIGCHLWSGVAVMLLNDADRGAHILGQGVNTDAHKKALRGIVVTKAICITHFALVVIIQTGLLH